MGTQRDYYADLELPPTADAADIRKQFRKLALKYHPDRNPGREQEVNSQFQLIQSAHEVLSDPEAKNKYDASRSRSKYSGASGVKGNPWANAGAQYPPPPRRNAAPRPAASGAQRWQRFSSGVPPTAKQYTASDTEAKKNAAKAFENMRKGPTAKASEQARPTPPPPPPRTESARQRAQASFGSRKTGFHPRTTMGDEPPVANNNYTSRPAAERYGQGYDQESSRPVPSPPPPPPPPPPRTAMPPDPLSQFRNPESWADPRQSSPYTSHGGEKTNPFDSTPISRAKSTREPNRRDEPPADEDAFNRQRSASAPKGPNPAASTGFRNTEQNEAPSSPSIAPEDRPKVRLKKTRSGFSNVAGDATGNPTNGTSFEPPSTPQNASTDNSSMYETPSLQSKASKSIQNRNTNLKELQPNGSGTSMDAKPRKLDPSSPPTSSPSGRQYPHHQLTPFELQQKDLLTQLINNAGAGSTKTTGTRNPKLDHPVAMNRADKPSISFTIPVMDDTFARTSPDHSPFVKRSTDDINTSFTDDDGQSGWHFSAGGVESGASPTKGRTAGRQGRRSPIKRPAPSPIGSSGIAPEATKSESAFNPDGWSDKFGPQTFVPPQTKSVSPTRASRASSRKPRPNKKHNAATLIDDSSSSSEEEEVMNWRGRKTQGDPPAADSPQAMDIDSPPIIPSGPSPQPAQQGHNSQPFAPPRPPKVNESPPNVASSEAQSMPGSSQLRPTDTSARNINVEPSRPEWRPGNVGGTGPKVPESPSKAYHPNNVGSEDSEEFLAGFTDLKNVAPFTQQRSGLRSLVDLQDNLPFESKSSSDMTAAIPKAPPLVFPSAPQAPAVPESAKTPQPNAADWERYVKSFEAYMQEWDRFNGLVVEHFATRKAQNSRIRGERGYSFLASRNDGEIQEYYSTIQQDTEVQRQWTDACSRHKERLEELIKFRMKMR